MKMSEALSVNAASRAGKGKNKVLRSLEIEKSENDGHTVTHRFHNSDGPGYHDPETHVFSSKQGKEMIAHLQKHLDIKARKPADPEEKGEGATPAYA